MSERDVELVTLYNGADVDDDQAGALLEILKLEFPDFEYEMHPGNQPLYHFLISGE